MNKTIFGVIGVLVVAAVVVAMSAFYTVHQTELALVLQFGEPKRVVSEPGLKIKTPFIQDVTYYDRRVLDYDSPPSEVILPDGKRLVVDAYTRFRITNPLLFYQTVRTEMGFRARLGSLVDSALRLVMGKYPLDRVLSAERAEIMSRIKERVSDDARPFGVEIVDVRVRRADIPEQVSKDIFARMRADFEREAKELRAKGEEEAQRIRAEADRERTVILAEAQKKAQILRGEGDAESVRIYADAFNRDVDFFAFYRSMEAYREALGGDGTTMVLSPDSDFFRFFEGARGRARGE